jgi:hypothetical protein
MEHEVLAHKLIEEEGLLAWAGLGLGLCAPSPQAWMSGGAGAALRRKAYNGVTVDGVCTSHETYLQCHNGYASFACKHHGSNFMMPWRTCCMRHGNLHPRLPRP